MKKAMSIFLSLCMLFSFVLTACAAEETQNETTIILKIDSPAITVNGKDVLIDAAKTPIYHRSFLYRENGRHNAYRVQM